MEAKEIKLLSQLLADGRCVCLKNVIVCAKEVPEDVVACQNCEMLEKCDMTICDICAETDAITHRKNILVMC